MIAPIHILKRWITTSATGGAGTADPSGAREVTGF